MSRYAYVIAWPDGHRGFTTCTAELERLLLARLPASQMVRPVIGGYEVEDGTRIQRVRRERRLQRAA